MMKEIGLVVVGIIFGVLAINLSAKDIDYEKNMTQAINKLEAKFEKRLNEEMLKQKIHTNNMNLIGKSLNKPNKTQIKAIVTELLADTIDLDNKIDQLISERSLDDLDQAMVNKLSDKVSIYVVENLGKYRVKVARSKLVDSVIKDIELIDDAQITKMKEIFTEYFISRDNIKTHPSKSNLQAGLRNDIYQTHKYICLDRDEKVKALLNDYEVYGKYEKAVTDKSGMNFGR